MLVQLDPVVLEAVGRASRRSSNVVHEEMMEGLYDLATIASVAPWFGILGTILGIVNSFQGISGEKWSGIAAIYEGLSAAMWFTALGLLVGLVAFWSYQHLSDRLRALDLEMENASQELLNQLSRFPARFATDSGLERDDGPIFGALPPEDVQRDEKDFRRCYFLAEAALVLAWFVQASRYFLSGSLSLHSSVWAASFGIPITFGVSCLFLYPIWSRLLHRRPGALVAMGSALCLCWSVAELVLGRPLP